MRRLATLAVVVVSVWMSASVRANGVRDQGRIFGTNGIVSLGTDAWSQSITTGIAGELQGIQISIEDYFRPQPPIIDFNFSLFDGGNPPTDPALFSQQLTIFGSVDGFLYTWDVSTANLFFNVGDILTFALSVQQTGVDVAADYRDDGNGYAGGELFKNGTALPLETSDMAFITYVAEFTDLLLGDVNLDGLVNGLDVDPFVEVLLNGSDDNATRVVADMNSDGEVNGLDVDPFVEAVVGGAQSIPEPSTLLLGLLALGVIGALRKWGV